MSHEAVREGSQPPAPPLPEPETPGDTVPLATRLAAEAESITEPEDAVAPEDVTTTSLANAGHALLDELAGAGIDGVGLLAAAVTDLAKRATEGRERRAALGASREIDAHRERVSAKANRYPPRRPS